MIAFGAIESEEAVLNKNSFCQALIDIVAKQVQNEEYAGVIYAVIDNEFLSCNDELYRYISDELNYEDFPFISAILRYSDDARVASTCSGILQTAVEKILLDEHLICRTVFQHADLKLIYQFYWENWSGEGLTFSYVKNSKGVYIIKSFVKRGKHYFIEIEEDEFDLLLAEINDKFTDYAKLCTIDEFFNSRLDSVRLCTVK